LVGPVKLTVPVNLAKGSGALFCPERGLWTYVTKNVNVAGTGSFGFAKVVPVPNLAIDRVVTATSRLEPSLV